MTTNNFTENDRIFYADGYRIGQEALAKGKNETNIFAGIRKLYEQIDQLNDLIFDQARKSNYPIDCKKGCEWCCHQPVFLLSHEVHFLKSYLGKHLAPDQFGKVLTVAKDKNDKVEHLSQQEILNYKSPCPLLVNGVCSAYEARPMACRIYLSSKVSTCKKFYDDPENKDNYPALLEFPLRAGRMLNEGFRAALKSNGILSVEFRMEEGLINHLEVGLLG
ncbi:YkgJ family cysteine cluster protein [Puteibacter caeruleilacunae]|nr:YkgJ family cysteine cluster protein [Puteibacter caeruleilacunae]